VFLKLLEEPPADTTLVLTSSEPGALLPTIRSRVVAMRVAPLSDAEVGEFLGDDAVRGMLNADSDAPHGEDERMRAADGLPGALLGAAGRSEALAQARRILESRAEPIADRYLIAVGQGVGKARGGFSETLDAVTVLLHDRARAALGMSDEAGALAAARAIDAVERAKALAHGNVSPQLVAAALLNELCEVLDE
jgi:DNA polymerase-3 subunit delta'